MPGRVAVRRNGERDSMSFPSPPPMLIIICTGIPPKEPFLPFFGPFFFQVIKLLSQLTEVHLKRVCNIVCILFVPTSPNLVKH